MNLLYTVIKQVLLLEIHSRDGVSDVRFWLARRDKHNRFVLKPLKGMDSETLKRWAYYPVVLFVTGDDVVAKPYQQDDSFVKKIINNEKLLWTIQYGSDSQESFIAFVRKEITEKYEVLLADHSLTVLGRFVGKEVDSNKENLLLSLYEEQLSWSKLRRNKPLLNACCQMIYHQIQIPVLLLFFALLLGNFFVNNHLRKEYDVIQNQISVQQRNEKRSRENRLQLGRLEEKYQNFYSGSLALLADRIASYVPVNVDLTLLSIFPLASDNEFSSIKKQESKERKDLIRVKGEVSTPGSVTLFTQLLAADPLFSKIEIVALNRQKEGTIYLFELQLML